MPSIKDAQFHRIATFVLEPTTLNDDQDYQQHGLVSLTPTIDKLMGSFSIKKALRQVKIPIKIKKNKFFFFKFFSELNVIFQEDQLVLYGLMVIRL